MRPKRGLTIRRDREVGGAAHHRAGRAPTCTSGSAWATARDRGLFMETIRYPSRFAVLDAPGYSALSTRDAACAAFDAEPRRPSASSPAGEGARGETRSPRPARGQWTSGALRRGDQRVQPQGRSNGVEAVDLHRRDRRDRTCSGRCSAPAGGNEVRSSMLLGELRNRPRRCGGRRLAGPDGRHRRSGDSHDDRQALPVRDGARRQHAGLAGRRPGLAQRLGRARRGRRWRRAARRASNALLDRPQALGHRAPARGDGPAAGRSFYPELFMEVDAHGGGIDVRGGVLPGIPYVLIGRGRGLRLERHVWPTTTTSTSSSRSSATRTARPPRAARRTTCYMGPLPPDDDVLRRSCSAATSSESEKAVTFQETVHGPVSGTVTVGGKPYAVANTPLHARTRDRLGGFIGSASNRGVRSPRDFRRAAGTFGFTFNLFYVDHRNISVLSRPGGCRSGRRGTEPEPAHARHRPSTTGAASWRPSRPSPGREPEERHPAQLEREPGRGLRRRRTATGPTSRSTAATCSVGPSAATDSLTCCAS